MKNFIQRLAWGTDAGFYRLIPQQVSHPKTETEVQTIINKARQEHRHLTFRAAGTSLSGQAISDDILLVIGKNWEQYEVLDNGLRIRLQPGIIGARVQQILKPYNRCFTPDPASIKSAMVGGIVSNNASGMCCGTHANSYRMLDSVRIILADGTVLDTGDETSKEEFRKTHPNFIKRIEELRDKTLNNKDLCELIRRKYSIKNVTGLTILPFVEYTDPFDIIAHLIVGAEGTLAFLSNVTMHTGEVYPYSASALLLFPTTRQATDAVVNMKKTGMLSAAEYFDRGAMRVVENDFPELLNQPDDAGAVLIKVEGKTEEELRVKELKVKELAGCELNFVDGTEAARLWAMRSGIFPAVGGTRPIGTTCLIEDIAFPIEFLSDATADLQALFKEHNYPDAVIYGHALEGNYHFILNQRFDTQEAVNQYDRMMHAVVDLVVDKYHGSLKAEHGTGRNMAPFVRREWGDEAYQLMKEVKTLFDPENIFNPGVIFNEDEQSYIQNLKPLTEANPLIDRCIECGFCEVNCVSCGFALSSRQRIVVQREIARLRKMGQENEANKLAKAFRKIGKDLCAGDGLCSTSCPIKINVGEYIHLLREQEMSGTGKRIGKFAANHFEGVGGAIGSVLGVASAAQWVLGDKIMSTVCKGIHAMGMPLWTPAMPHKTKFKSSKVEEFPSPSPLTVADSGTMEHLNTQTLKVVYFPSCLNQRMGLAKGDPSTQPTMGDMVELLNKAGYEVIFPKNMKKLCCGTIWESKGMPDLADQKGAELHQALWEASNHGEYPILCDQSPCLYRMRHTNEKFESLKVQEFQSSSPLKITDSGTMEHSNLGTLSLFEPAEFIDKFVLNRLNITPLEETVMLHITCTMRKMHLEDTIIRVAKKCAKKVVVPEEIGCCAFAGDKGFTHPELNDWALRKLRAEVEKAGGTLGISNSRTCEIGLTSHSGIPYMNIAYLVNKASKKK